MGLSRWQVWRCSSDCRETEPEWTMDLGVRDGTNGRCQELQGVLLVVSIFINNPECPVKATF